MWMVKQQSRKHPSGIPASPSMETKAGAEALMAILQKAANEESTADSDPKNYFVAQVISRRGKEK